MLNEWTDVREGVLNNWSSCMERAKLSCSVHATAVVETAQHLRYLVVSERVSYFGGERSSD